MLRNYLLLAWKVLLRRKFFTFISLVGISLTLATLLVVTALIDNYSHPKQLGSKQSRTLMVEAMMAKGKFSIHTHNASYGFHDKYVRTIPGLEEHSITGENTVVAYPSGHKTTVSVRRTDGAFWRIVEFEFLEGTGFTDDDNAQERPVAVISEKARTQFFGNESALGKSLRLDDRTYRVVGVVKNVPITLLFASGDVWTPITIGLTAKSRSAVIDEGGYFSVLLAKQESDIPRIKANFQAMLPKVQFLTNDYDRMIGGPGTFFEIFARGLFGFNDQEEDFGKRDDAKQMIGIMIAAALAFMLLPAINLVNLNVSRILERSSEIGVRKAFGASSHALVGQFVVENLVLTVLGGIIGLLLAETVLIGINQIDLVASAAFHVNARVALYALALSAVFGVLSGVLPAWKMSRLPIVASLKGDLNV